MDYVGLGINVGLCALAGISWCLVAKLGWNESYEWIRRTVLGAIVGLLFFFMGVMAGDPASVLALFSTAYLATDFFSALELKVGQ